MPRRGGRDRWRPGKVPAPAQRPSFVIEPTRAATDGPDPPNKRDEVVPPPSWLKPGVLVNYHAVMHPRMAKGVPALRGVRVLSFASYPGFGQDWIVKIEGKRQPVPIWTLELVSEEPGSPAVDRAA